MVNKLLQLLLILMIVLTFAGCKDRTINQELIDLQIKYDELTSLTKENNSILLEMKNRLGEHDETNPVKETEFLEFLKLPFDEQNELVEHYAHSGRGGSGLSNYDLYMLVLLLDIFHYDNLQERFSSRDKTEIDNNLILSDPNLSEILDDYIVIRFFEPINILNMKSDGLSLYVFHDNLYLSLYQNSKFIKGFTVNPIYYKEMFIKVGILTRDLLEIQCGKSPDCWKHFP